MSLPQPPRPSVTVIQYQQGGRWRTSAKYGLTPEQAQEWFRAKEGVRSVGDVRLTYHPASREAAGEFTFSSPLSARLATRGHNARVELARAAHPLKHPEILSTREMTELYRHLLTVKEAASGTPEYLDLLRATTRLRGLLARRKGKAEQPF